MKAAEENQRRTYFLVVLSFIFPPLAVLEHGCGIVLLASILTLLGWFPGVLLALFMTLVAKPGGHTRRRKKFIRIPLGDDAGDYAVDDGLVDEVDEIKRKGAYIRLADGAVAEVVEDDAGREEKRKR